MSTIRDLEVRFTGLEDNILERFGYREYTVEVGNQLLIPTPGIIQKSLSAYSETKLASFIQALGGQGNPISFYELAISRLIDESLIRQFSYWKLTRDSIVSECLPVSITVEDARYMVVLATIKQTVNQ